MKKALFLNGVFETVFQEILKAQKQHPGQTFFLQPYSQGRIVVLDDHTPTVSKPIPVYISTTSGLEMISFQAEIVGWEDKQSISKERKAELDALIREYQPTEREVYLVSPRGKHAVNLIHIRNLKKIESPVPVSCLTKRNGTPVKPRSRSGGWVNVSPLPDWVGTGPTILGEKLQKDLDDAAGKSLRDVPSTRLKRLADASAIPDRVQVVSNAFRRNPDVIVEVLIRASGVCESCGQPAPFIRSSDRSPYLEIHHCVPLASGGEDTIENAIALCPNCHRRMHFGLEELDQGQSLSIKDWR